MTGNDRSGRDAFVLPDSETQFPQKYGIPQAARRSRKNALVSNREPAGEERLAGIEPKSHFEKAREKRGIPVYTPLSTS